MGAHILPKPMITRIDQTNLKMFALDNSNNIYVAGHGYSSQIEQEAITIKYAPDGTPLWVQEYGLFDRHCRNFHVKVNEAGEVFTMGINGPTSPGMVEILCLKYSAMGTLVWAFPWSIIGYPDCYPLFFLMDDADNAYVGGYARNSSNHNVAYIFKMTNGSLVWSHQMTSPAQSAAYLTADFDSDGNIVCAGTYEDANTDALFVKYSPTDGSVIKQGFYNSPFDMNDGFNNMCVKDEFIYFCGISEGNGTENDMIAMKVNTEFDTIWNIRYNSFSNGFDMANRIQIDNEDNVVIAGFTINTAGYFCRVWKYSNPLGIADHGYMDAYSLDVYPNPASNTLYFQHTTDNRDASYVITNIAGQILEAGAIPAGPSQEIDLTKLSPGIYFLQILDGNKKFYAKFIKQ